MNPQREVAVRVPIGDIELEGNLMIPPEAKGLVLFAHGSGSSRLSPRNRYVAKVLNDNKLATLLTDLLTPQEEKIDEQTREYRFDIELLATRLIAITDWLTEEPQTKTLKIGYFGSSTGAAGALIAAAKRKNKISAVVSRGGRPDLAKSFLTQVRAPTLLLVGGNDSVVIELNEQAFALLSCEKKIEIIPGATHLFEEPGTLEQVAKKTATWLIHYLEIL